MNELKTENDALAAVKQNQKSITEKEGTIATLAEVINAQESAIKAAAIAPPTDMGKKREDLAAEIAIGTAKPEARAALDARIAEEKKIHAEASAKAEQVIGPATAAIAGLHRRLEQAEKELASLTKEGESLYQALLWAEAERTGAEYLERADELIYLFRRLAGLNELLGENVLEIWPTHLAIPAIGRLKAFESAEKCGPNNGFIHHANEFREEKNSTDALKGIESYRVQILLTGK